MEDFENNFGSRVEEVFEWLINIFYVVGGEVKDSIYDYKIWKLRGYICVYVYYKGKYCIMKKKINCYFYLMKINIIFKGF